MRVLGDARAWSRTFPRHLIPRILDLVVNTWRRFDKPQPDEWEVTITRRFRRALKVTKDLKRLPFRIDRESVEDGFETGAELGRLDLRFTPAGSAREEVYFTFECKRLNVPSNGSCRPLASEYVKEGMMRFVSSQYAGHLQDGGMIGYVLDGRTSTAISAVEKSVQDNQRELQMRAPAEIGRSSLRPRDPRIRETRHQLTRGPFRIHHLFLAC